MIRMCKACTAISNRLPPASHVSLPSPHRQWPACPGRTARCGTIIRSCTQAWRLRRCACWGAMENRSRMGATGTRAQHRHRLTAAALAREHLPAGSSLPPVLYPAVPAKAAALMAEVSTRRRCLWCCTASRRPTAAALPSNGASWRRWPRGQRQCCPTFRRRGSATWPGG
jgi:hypothetical protein